MADEDRSPLIIADPVLPWPPIAFSISRREGQILRALFIFVVDAKTGARMWQLTPETGVHPTGEVASRSNPRPVELASEEAARARIEFDAGMRTLAEDHGVPIEKLTYGEVPQNMHEFAPAGELQKGASYDLMIVGNVNGRISFTA